MSFKDITEARLREFRRNLCVLGDDLDEFLKCKNEFRSYSRHSVEVQLDDCAKYPSRFYAYYFGDSLVEIRRDKDTYVVFCRKVDFSESDYADVKSRFSCDFQFDLNQVRFVNLKDFSTAVSCFLYVIRLYTKSLELAQGVLVF